MAKKQHVGSSQVLLLPVVVERALAGAGVAALPSRRESMELVELGIDQTWA